MNRFPKTLSAAITGLLIPAFLCQTLLVGCGSGVATSNEPAPGPASEKPADGTTHLDATIDGEKVQLSYLSHDGVLDVFKSESSYSVRRHRLTNDMIALSLDGEQGEASIKGDTYRLSHVVYDSTGYVTDFRLIEPNGSVHTIGGARIPRPEVIPVIIWITVILCTAGLGALCLHNAAVATSDCQNYCKNQCPGSQTTPPTATCVGYASCTNQTTIGVNLGGGKGSGGFGCGCASTGAPSCTPITTSTSKSQSGTATSSKTAAAVELGDQAGEGEESGLFGGFFSHVFGGEAGGHGRLHSEAATSSSSSSSTSTAVPTITETITETETDCSSN